MGFVHLHVHSEYSMLDGACRIEDLPKKAKSLGQSAIAITDHGNMFGAVHFYNECVKEGIQPIIGCEVYVAPHSRKEKNKDERYHHLILLCENEIGYRNLSKLVTAGYLEGFYGKPRVDEELLIQYHEGLICLSACLAGKIPFLVLNDRFEEAEKEALRYGEIFGEGHFYLEVQNHLTEEEEKVRKALINISNNTGLPLVATNDAHYTERKDATTQAVLMCIQMGKLMSDGKPLGFETEEYYLKSEEEMEVLFSDCPDALQNTVYIAQQCDFHFDFSKRHLPEFPLPAGKSADKYLKELAEEGLMKYREAGKLSLDSHSFEDYKFRMIYELMMISKMGYSDYFLIVRDFVNYAKESGIPVGPGRGSGAGSLVAYLVGITEIDSIKYDLLFERFLNPERVSMPDFDIDFCYNRRDEVIEYVTKKYGKDHVSQIAAFGTLGARAAVRDVGRVLGISYGETDKVASLIPHKPDMTIREALKKAELKTLYEESYSVRQLLDTAIAVEGMPRHITTHAAGVVITEKPISEYLPLTVSSGAILTQFDMTTVEKLGLLKFDFLALRYLTVIDDACKFIRKREPGFQFDERMLSDEKSYGMISEGETDGVFQLESPGMKRLLTQMKPRCVEDLMIAIALYRPGPMESISDFLAFRSGERKQKYEIEGLAEILDGTSGCIIYQEQVMQIFRKIAGYSYGRADIVRRAMAKKHANELEAERGQFLSGAIRNGVSEANANALFDSMLSFASYAFNKSHAAAYAVISFRTAYLKAHYPAEYMSALLTSVCGDAKKTGEYISALEKKGIKILPPSVNESDVYFCPTAGGVRFGLLGIKNLGEGFVSSLVAERKNAAFDSPIDFVRRMLDHGLNKSQLLSLISSGALDCFNIYRSRMYEGAEELIRYISSEKAQMFGGQINLFSAVGEMPVSQKEEFEFPVIEEYSLSEKLKGEKEMTGLWFSGHPLHEYSLNIAEMHALSVAEVLAGFDESGQQTGELKNGENIKVCGMISSVSSKTSKAGNHFSVFKIEDIGGELECLAFEKVLAKISDYLMPGVAVYLEGKLSVREEEAPKITVFEALPLLSDIEFRKLSGQISVDSVSETASAYLKESKSTATVKEEPTAAVYKKLYIRLTPDEKKNRQIHAIATIFSGNISLIYYDSASKTYRDSQKKISLTPYLLSVLKEIAGDENVIPK